MSLCKAKALACRSAALKSGLGAIQPLGRALGFGHWRHSLPAAGRIRLAAGQTAPLARRPFPHKLAASCFLGLFAFRALHSGKRKKRRYFRPMKRA